MGPSLANRPDGGGRLIVGVVSTDPGAARACADILERSGASALSVPAGAGWALGEIAALVIVGDHAEGLPGGLVEAAIESGMAVLCISGGLHLLNEVFGGAPAGPVDGHGPIETDGKAASAYHRVFIAPGSKLAAVVGSGGFVRLNSRHDYGITEAGRSPRLAASAYSLEDGVVEALESPEHHWVIGVQFRPDLRGEIPPHFDRLFQSLIDRAAEYKSAN